MPTLKLLFMAIAILSLAWSEVSTVMWSVMKSGPNIRQRVIRAPSFFGLPAEEGNRGPIVNNRENCPCMGKLRETLGNDHVDR